MKPFPNLPVQVIRYGIAALILVGGAAVGTNIEGISSLSQYRYQRLIEARQTSTDLVLDALNPSLSIPYQATPTAPTTRYRVTVVARFAPVEYQPGAGLRMEPSSTETLQIIGLDGSGENVYGRLQLERSQIAKAVSVIVEVPSSVINLQLAKENADTGPVYVEKVWSTVLQTANLAEASGLNPSEFATDTDRLQVDTTWPTETVVTKTKRFSAKNQSVTVRTTASGKAFTRFEFPLSVIGNGGNGRYRLEVAEVGATGNTVLAAHDFYLDDVKFIRTTMLKDQGTVYTVPLSVYTEPGKQYDISLKNSQVSFNWLNTVAAYQSGNSWAVRVYGLEEASSDKGLPATAFIEQSSPRTWQYRYISSGTFSDVLGVSREAVLSARRQNQQTFFDTSRHALISGGSITYSFTFPYPLDEARLAMGIVEGDLQDVQASYSYDNGQSWNVLGASQGSASAKEIGGIITPSTSVQSLLVRLDPQHTNRQSAQVPAIGVSSFSLIAQLQQL